MVMKDKTHFDFSFVIFFNGIQEGVAVSKLKRYRAFMKAKVYLPMMAF